jgi:hypothetical protein
MNLEARVSGVKGVRDALAALGKPKARPVYVRALQRSTQSVSRHAERLAPRLTGRLSKGYRERKGRRPADFQFTGNRVVYAPVHEFGWPKKGIRAQPSLAPGVDRAAPGFAKIWDEEFYRATGSTVSAFGKGSS